MPVKVRFEPEVERDLEEAYGWYEGQKEGLGEEFFARVEYCFETISHFPEIHPVVYQGYRRGLVQRFPYAVFYEFDGVEVVINAVFNTYRDPIEWRERLSR